LAPCVASAWTRCSLDPALRLRLEQLLRAEKGYTVASVAHDPCRFRKLYPFDFATTDESEHDRRMIAIGLSFPKISSSLGVASSGRITA
jgi:hypothetical protein